MKFSCGSVFILVLLGLLSLASCQTSNTIYLNSQSCLNGTANNVLMSKNGMFALKFITATNRNVYLVIAYVKYNETVVWTANRNTPIKGKPCLRLGANADLVLEDTTNGSLHWNANIGQLDHMELEGSGNLLLQNRTNVTLWESFNNPTDTIIQGGHLRSGKALISSKSLTDLSEGPYMLKMEPGGVVWYSRFSELLPYEAWTFNPLGFQSSSSLIFALNSYCNKTRMDYGFSGESITLVQEGNLTAECMDETQSLASRTVNIVTGAQLGDGIFRFLRLDMDGNLRTYIQSPTQQYPDTDIFVIFFQDVCKLPNICGSLGICISGGTCICEQENIFEQLQSTPGCAPKKEPICGASNQLIELEGIDYFANPYMKQSVSTLEQCKSSCLSNCSCAAVFFWGNSQACYHYQELKSLRRVSDQSIKAFIKVGPGSFIDKSRTNDSKQRTIILATVLPVVCIAIFASLLGLCLHRYRRMKPQRLRSEDDVFLENLPGLPPRFSYKEMEADTQGFSRKLGTGGFGAVFEEELCDGRKITVKKLVNADHGHLQFRAGCNFRKHQSCKSCEIIWLLC